MYKIILLSVLSFSNLYASELMKPEICYSNGECQMAHQVYSTTRCYKVKTGVTPEGTVSCEVRCAPIAAGYVCEMFAGKVYGACKQENILNSDTDTYNCSNAIDQDDL